MRRVALLLCALLLAACAEPNSTAPQADEAGAEGEATEAGSEGAAAAADCGSLEGETVTLVVPFSPGGGYDAYARMLAPYLAEQIGADVIVENQEGAGGLLAINSLAGSPPDGTRIAIMNAVGVGGGALAGAEGAQFELDGLSYIGRVGASYHIFATGADSSFQTFDDVLAADTFRIGSTGPGAADFVNASVLRAMFERDWEIITGFAGSEENELAVTAGDVDAMTGDFDSRLPAVENGDHRALLLLGPEPDPALPDTPALLELDLDERQTALAESMIELLEFGRPIVGPPDMPEDVLTCLRDALADAVEDPELQQEAETTGRPIAYLPGEEVDAQVQSLLESPQEFRDVLTEAFAE